MYFCLCYYFLYFRGRFEKQTKLKNGVLQLVVAEIIPLNLIQVMLAEERAIFNTIIPVFCFINSIIVF